MTDSRTTLTDEQETAWWEPGGGCERPTIVIEWTPGPVRLEVSIQPGVDGDQVTADICSALNECLNFEPDDPSDYIDNTPVEAWNEFTPLPQRAVIVRVACSGSVQNWRPLTPVAESTEAVTEEALDGHG